MPSAEEIPQPLPSWVPGNVSWLVLSPRFWGSQGEDAHIPPSVHALSCWNSSGIATAPLGVSARAPQPSTHLALIWHLVGRVVFLHHLRSQHLEAPAELREEQPVRVPWGHTEGLGTAPGYWHAGEGPAGTSCAQERPPRGWRGHEREKPCSEGRERAPR